MKRRCLFDNQMIRQIVSSPRSNSLYALINSVRQVGCILQGGLQLVLKVANILHGGSLESSTLAVKHV